MLYYELFLVEQTKLFHPSFEIIAVLQNKSNLSGIIYLQRRHVTEITLFIRECLILHRWTITGL